VRKKNAQLANIFASYSLLMYNPAMDFELVTSYTPRGDQPRAIDELMAGLAAGEKHQVLLGVTGSGKTSFITSSSSFFRTMRSNTL
jgi:excinuclease UvrABC helicase subunit UvrB